MNSQIVLCGRGGQGVIFAARAIGEAAMACGLPVILAETHGMAQRGGSVASFVKIGEFASPLVRRGAADLVLCLAPTEMASAATYLRAGGTLIADGPEGCPATEIARELGVVRGTNPVILGFAAGRAAGLLPPSRALRDVLARLSRPAARDGILRAFDEGLARARR